MQSSSIPASISKEDKNDKIETKVDPMEVAKESLKQGMDALGGKPGIMRIVSLIVLLQFQVMSLGMMLRHVIKK